MVDYIKNTDNFGLYICEGGLNYDGGVGWFDAGKEMKEIDFDDIDSGVDGIHLPYSGKMKKTPNFNKQIIDFFKGQGVNISLGEGHWIYTMQGRFGGTSEQNRTDKMEDLELLYMKHVTLTQPKLYLGYRKIGEVWDPHVDPNEVVKYYLPGVMLIGEYWRDAHQNYYNWRVVFRGVW